MELRSSFWFSPAGLDCQNVHQNQHQEQCIIQASIALNLNLAKYLKIVNSDLRNVCAKPRHLGLMMLATYSLAWPQEAEKTRCLVLREQMRSWLVFECWQRLEMGFIIGYQSRAALSVSQSGKGIQWQYHNL